MPLCENTNGWWLWKKRCERWAEGTCTHCGKRVCETHARHQEDGNLTCRACAPDDESWDTQSSSSFSGSKHDGDGDVSGDSPSASHSADSSSSDSGSSGGSDSGGSSSD